MVRYTDGWDGMGWDGQTDGRTDGWMDGWTDGLVDWYRTPYQRQVMPPTRFKVLTPYNARLDRWNGGMVE